MGNISKEKVIYLHLLKVTFKCSIDFSHKTITAIKAEYISLELNNDDNIQEWYVTFILEYFFCLFVF